MDRVSGTRRKGPGLERPQASMAQGRTQALSVYAIALSLQLRPQPAGTIATLMLRKNLNHGRFPTGYRSSLLSAYATHNSDLHAQHLAEVTHGQLLAMSFDKVKGTHNVGEICEKMAFFKISNRSFESDA